jgi:hypothetical protein
VNRAEWFSSTAGSRRRWYSTYEPARPDRDGMVEDRRELRVFLTSDNAMTYATTSLISHKQVLLQILISHTCPMSMADPCCSGDDPGNDQASIVGGNAFQGVVSHGVFKVPRTEIDSIVYPLFGNVVEDT